MSKDPLVSVVISSMSNGSKIRLSFVQVMNWKGGWDSMWQWMTPLSASGRYWIVGVNTTRAGSATRHARHEHWTVKKAIVNCVVWTYRWLRGLQGHVGLCRCHWWPRRRTFQRPQTWSERWLGRPRVELLPDPVWEDGDERSIKIKERGGGGGIVMHC